MMRKPKLMIALGLALSLGATACGEASFTGKGGKKNDPKSQNENPDVPLIPSGTNPNVPTVPEGGDDTPDCITQNGTLIQCPDDITTSPSQN